MDLANLSPETVFFVIIAFAVLTIGGAGAGVAFMVTRLDRAAQGASNGPGMPAPAAAAPALSVAEKGRRVRINVIGFIALLTAVAVVASLLIEPATRGIGWIALGIFVAVALGGGALMVVAARLPHDDERSAPVAAPRKPYLMVFFGLAVITLIEIGVTFLPVIPHAPILAALSIGKIVLVAMYYMHLKTDSPYFTYTILVPVPFVVMILAAVLVTEIVFGFQ